MNKAPIATKEGFSVGDRVEAFTIGNVTVKRPGLPLEKFDSINAVGVIVAFNDFWYNGDLHQTVVMLSDPDISNPTGRPKTWRFDQIRPERPMSERLGFWESDTEIAVQRVERRNARRAKRRGLSKIINLFDRPSATEIAATTALMLSIRLNRAADRYEPADCMVYTQLIDVSFGDRVKVRNTNGAGWVKDCIFLCEARGWRFYTYPHGGSHAQEKSMVVADHLLPRQKRAPVKV